MERGGEFEFQFEFQSCTEVEYKLNLGLNIEFGLSLKVSEVFCKVELLQVGIFFPYPFICMRNFINKKIGNQRN